jgi:hypothetical protein
MSSSPPLTPQREGNKLPKQGIVARSRNRSQWKREFSLALQARKVAATLNKVLA